MSLTLRWINKNLKPVQLAIYRGDSVLDKTALPATPLVVLTAGEEMWVDTTAVPNATYHYMFKTTQGSEIIYSRNYPMTVIPRRGPGPSELLWGDGTMGYFGSVRAHEFISGFELMLAMGYTGSEATARLARYTPIWHKFIRNNKILYAPNGCLSKTMTWLEVAKRGAAYGTGTKEPNSAIHDTVQNAQVKIRNQDFRIRLPLGYSENPALLVPTAELSGDKDWLCEWQDMVASQINIFSPLRRVPNVSMVQGTGMNFPSSYSGSFCAELNEDNVSFTRGCSSTSVTATMYTRIADSNAVGWLPILELIE